MFALGLLDLHPPLLSMLLLSVAAMLLNRLISCVRARFRSGDPDEAAAGIVDFVDVVSFSKSPPFSSDADAFLSFFLFALFFLRRALSEAVSPLADDLRAMAFSILGYIQQGALGAPCCSLRTVYGVLSIVALY